MIIVHHLENSRSQRVLWMLEELGADYEVKSYQRDKKTSLAPKALKKIHPLGKSPVIEHDGRMIAESGAILEYLSAAHGGALAPPPDDPLYWRCKYWLHAAEGSYMAPLLISLLLSRMQSAPMPFFARPIARRLVRGVNDAYLDNTLNTLFSYVEAELAEREWFAGPALSLADIAMSFPLEALTARGQRGDYPNIGAFVVRIQSRPAYKRALERGGPYALLT